MLFLALASIAFAQDGACPQGCIDPDDLSEECVPAEPDICPKQIFQSASGCVSWLNDNGTWANNVQGNSVVTGCWQAEPMTSTSPYSAGNLTYPMVGEGYGSSVEWSCGIETGGTISCFGGGNVTVSVPSGEGPYSALSVSGGGSTGLGRYGVLNTSGQIRVWGNSGSGFGTPPTSSGFTELGVGRDAACAVGISNGGVSCWGDNLENLVTNASKPSTGTYVATEVGRYVAGAVQDDGTLDMWSTARAGSGQVTNASTFIANRPNSGVASFELAELFDIVGVAYHTDGTATVWIPNGSIPTQMTNAPGWDDYGSTTLTAYKPQGPDGAITFRGRLEISVNGTNGEPTICGVINDPQGLVNDHPLDDDGLYNFGDAICWPDSTNGYPRVEAQCLPAF